LTASRGHGKTADVTSAQCTFCKIAAGELAAHLIFEDADFLAFLDHRPLFAGHCLLVPRRHFETVLDLPVELGGVLFAHTQRLARAVEVGMKADGFFLAVNNRVSQSVPHVHTHVIPRRKKDGLKGFFWPRYKYSGEEEMVRVQQAIIAALG
jgi:histidine triad (HIT) family protein